MPPWERYQAQEGPWTKYRPAQAAAPARAAPAPAEPPPDALATAAGHGVGANFIEDYRARQQGALAGIKRELTAPPVSQDPLQAGLGGVASGIRMLGHAGNYVWSPFGAAIDEVIGRPVEAASGGRIPHQMASDAASIAVPFAGELNAARKAAGAAKAAGMSQVGHETMLAARGGAQARLAAPQPQVRMPAPATAVQLLKGERVSLTPGQRMGGMALAVEDKAMSAPILGDAIRGARLRGRESFNRAAMNRALAPIGEALPRDVPVGNDAVAHVEQRLGDAYTRANGLISNVMPDAEFAQGLAQVRAGLKGQPPSVLKAFDNIITDRVLSRLEAGPLDGAAVQDIKSQLGELAADNLAGGGAERTLGRHLALVADQVTALAGRKSPDYLAAQKAADRGWANFVRIRNAASRTGTDSGVFTPSQLKTAVRAEDRSVGKGGTARGSAPMADLANAGASAMNSVIPNSGTTDRAMLAAVTAGGAGVVPHVGLPVVGALAAASVPYLLMGRRIAGAALRPGASPELLAASAKRLQALSAQEPQLIPLLKAVTRRLRDAAPAGGTSALTSRAEPQPAPAQ